VGWARLNGSDFADNSSNMGWKAVRRRLRSDLRHRGAVHRLRPSGDFGSRIHAYTAGLTGGWRFPGGLYPYAKLGAAFEM